MVRKCLFGYGLDREHFNTSEWNPLSEIIKEGDTVVIKPNWVLDKNENPEGGTDCLVTHASILRAIIDYVALALKESGRIIVGDAPLNYCNFKKLMKVMHYDTVWDSCKKRGIDVTVLDFREDMVGPDRIPDNSQEEKGICVDLKNDSLFTDVDQKSRKYGSGAPTYEVNIYYHNHGHNKYQVNKNVLSADVIINLPKPKAHRKAGFTGALKNFVGVCSRKSSVPHYVIGNEKNGGDAYDGPNFFYGTEHMLFDKQNEYKAKGKNLLAFLIKVCRIPFWLFCRVTRNKVYYDFGDSYKNDTLWRSILDINRILIYADKDGVMRKTPQRRFFSLGDMIISGQLNGPLAPSPIDIGVILCSTDLFAFDHAVVKLMGFKLEMLPILKRIPSIKKYKIPYEKLDDIHIYSNDKGLNDKTVANMCPGIYGYFKPTVGWRKLSVKSK